MDIALIEAYVAAHRVARGNATVGNAVVGQGEGAHMHLEVAVLRPTAVFPHADGEHQVGAAVQRGQPVPLVDIEVGNIALHMHLAAFPAAHHHIQEVHLLVGGIEVERCDAHGNGHTDIVGIDRGLLCDAGGLLHAARGLL